MTIQNFDVVHDPDTGWFHSGDGVMKWMSNGVPIFQLDSSGFKTSDADAWINFSDRGALPTGLNAIRGVGVDYEDVVGWIAFEGQTEADAFRYSAYFQPQSGGAAKILGIGSFPTLNSGWSGNISQAYQAIINVQSGATVTTRGGDATAGIHPIWAKVAGDVGATWNTGMRVAPIWARA